jgi:hypothetical protein
MKLFYKLLHSRITLSTFSCGTNLLKPVYSTLRKMGHLNLGYIDDSLLIGDSRKECLENVNDTNWLFEKVGFIVRVR